MKELSLNVVVSNLGPALWYASVALASWIALLIIFGAFKAILYEINPSFFPHITKSCLYYGRVKHTRLKGGAVHHLDYPIFFSYLDLDEMRTIGWYFWPIFAVNKPYITFCSFDFKHHLKDFRAKIGKNFDLLRLVQEFVSTKSNGKLDKKYDQVQIMTHLTYFGYCFNPISIYYLKSSTSPDKTAGVIAEVSNTPWIEMHSYLLGEGFHGVESYKYIEPSANDEVGRVEAVWKKEFHVSPFMEMDYKYNFNFYEPGEKVVVTSKMIKESTKDVWFTANFELQRMSFTPLNLLYVLVFYPLQTRLIQVYIHYEAILLFFKGVPTFEHPNGTDVDFGFGITGERLGKVLWVFIAPFYFIASLFSSKTTTESKKIR